MKRTGRTGNFHSLDIAGATLFLALLLMYFVPSCKNGGDGITPQPLPSAPNITAVTPTAGTEGASVTFSATVTGGGSLTYDWFFGGGATPNASTEASPKVTLGDQGTYACILIVRNDAGRDQYEFKLHVSSESQQTSLKINSITRPRVDAKEGETVTFSADVSHTNPITYAWNFGGGAVPNESSDASPTVVLCCRSGVYFVNLTVTDGSETDNYDTVFYVRDALTAPTITGVVPRAGQSSTYAKFYAFVSGTSATSAEWHFGGGANPNASTEMSPYVQLATAGSYSASVTMFNANGQTKKEFVLVIANNEPVANWKLTTVDANASPGQGIVCTSIDGLPVIAYQDGALQNLKFVRALNTAGSSWDTPVTIDTTGNTGSFPDLAVINGLPAVAYIDSTEYAVKYALAKDSNGEGWSAPISLGYSDNQYSPNLYLFSPHLTTIQGNPRVYYTDSNGAGLMSVTSNDQLGSSWATPVALLPDSGGAYNRSAIFEDDSTLIMYSSEARIRVTWNVDTARNIWATPFEVFGDEIGNYSSMPSMSPVSAAGLMILLNNNNIILLSRALEGSNTKWSDPVPAAVPDSSFASASKIDNHISLFYGRHALRYQQSDDVDGELWTQMSSTVDDQSECSGISNVISINGHPAVAYFVDNALKFAYLASDIGASS